MMAYGSPAAMDEVEPYLLNVRGGRPTPPAVVEKTKARYAAIGGKSPLLEITQAQAGALESRLNALSPNQPYRVFVGMRHWTPFIQEIVPQILQAGFQNIVALCMTPYASKISTQAYFDQFDRALAVAGEAQGPKVTRLPAWHADPLFIQALADQIQHWLGEVPGATGPESKIIFTAHSLPKVTGQAEDPYAAQVRHTAQAVADRLGLAPSQWTLCYQSAGAMPGDWLGPSLETTLDQLASAGCRQVWVAPIGFVSDHIETLYDLDIEAAGRAKEKGLAFRRVAALNTHPVFIQALAQLILQGGHA
jgi:ferrochelatase